MAQLVHKSLSIKSIFLRGNAWNEYYAANRSQISEHLAQTVTKMLSCKTSDLGYKKYHCPNPGCNHSKFIFFTCKSSSCSPCGKKQLELWIDKQLSILPKAEWQHITLTMPDVLWELFMQNKKLLNEVSKLGADCILKLSANQKALPGIFTALHTFGRKMNINVHLHISTTTSGLSKNNKEWIALFFEKKTLMKMWRYRIINALREAYRSMSDFVIPAKVQKKLSHHFNFLDFLDQQYNRQWMVDCGEPKNDYEHNINYFARYVKRPPVAESKLKHYGKNNISMTYKNHKTGKYEKLICTDKEFIHMFIQHIPDKNFRLIRYYGFLANRVKNQYLQIVYQLIQCYPPSQKPKRGFAEMKIEFLGEDPMLCILCGHLLVCTAVKFGFTKTQLLLQYHQKMAIQKK